MSHGSDFHELIRTTVLIASQPFSPEKYRDIDNWLGYIDELHHTRKLSEDQLVRLRSILLEHAH